MIGVFAIGEDINSFNELETFFNTFPDKVKVYKLTNKDSKKLREINSQICEEVNEEVREKIIKELMYLRYDFSHKGTIYLVDIIRMIYLAQSNTSVSNYKKQVYPVIGKKYNQSVNNIKSNVIRATEAMFFNCEERRFKDYFGYYDFKKPGTKTIVNTIISKIKTKK